MALDIIVPPVSLTELVTAAVGSSSIPRDLILRKFAHWSGNGVLRPTGPLHIGRGKSRPYDPEEAFIGAVLLRLPFERLTAVKAVADVIRIELAKKGGHFETLWRAAKDRKDTLPAPHGSGNNPIFAAFHVRFDGATQKVQSVDVSLGRGSGGFITPGFQLYGDSLTIVPITFVFAGIRFP